jgi:hypothetical protein
MKYQDLESRQQAEQDPHQSQEKSGNNDFEASRISRSSSMRQANNYNSRYLPPLATEISPNEEHEQYDYQSPNSIASPSSNATPVRSMRPEPPQRSQRSQTTPSPYPGFGGGFVPDFSSAYDASLNTQFQSQPQSSAPHSSGKSSFSVDTDGSASKDKKEKVDPKSEVRYYGRGKSIVSPMCDVSTNRYRWRPEHQQEEGQGSEEARGFQDWRFPRTQRHHVRC